MTAPLIAVCIWIVAAQIVAILPSGDGHWRAAYALAAIGVPLAGWTTWEMGPWAGLLALAAGCSVLRWPLMRLTRWLLRLPAGDTERIPAARMAGHLGTTSEVKE